ncbi:MAG: tRNA (adenosine(37)-N6)-threonylcarbamoyltransferase complex dimerization subunit type 1 TsaB [Candidatus Solincola sediminis]|uniref:tRNA (Adenosine(37)-N6)-threonylcarbamoyltransferase complex dimerization subunit type 1 TsaB n=1 Tax=Candidatus Solincola sediminis TaxID=1797199 RepID=A0A1F2WII1_9ACTN|nr:MAG: tRNA (adenosine(37)-N6)-threonylcarbamoyltransferase complex dimerization subunit type 1 TsaB [Candidatus Solincola sediminis]OFW57942.1 MAG: tRNA (adenosine(37)-N6)-threonylcarbamoyltransferase complex dimerization subunit type 1 TsaB [Candidatus Solincola sediminis]
MTDWVLSLDLSSPQGILALEGHGKLFHREVAAGSRVSQLFVEADELLSLAGIDFKDIGAIGVAKGPGSFTGIRVAVMAAKTLAMVAHLPLVAPASLEVIAEGCRGPVEAVMVALDARRGEVYYGLYRLDSPIPATLEKPHVARPDLAAASLIQWQDRLPGTIGLTGSGLKAYEDAWPAGMLIIEKAGPDAQGLSRLCRNYYRSGRVEEALQLMPLYLRRPDLGGGATCA